MTKKKTFITLSAVVIVAIIATVSAIAIMTSISEKSNTLYIGSQSIELSEDKFSISIGDAIKEGEPLDKNPTIKNTGSSPCYVRAYLGLSNQSYKDNIVADIGDDWVLCDDGFYYYKSPLKPKESVSFFEHITINDTEMLDCDVYIFSESIHTNYKSLNEAWADFGVVLPNF